MARTKLLPNGGMTDDAIVAAAIRIIEQRATYHAVAVGSAQAAKDLVRLKLAGLEHEQFIVLYLNAQLRLIATETVALGTLTQAAVYPREVVKAALRNNAAAVIFAHNHPSGSPEPSHADELLTSTLKAALALVDVRVVDHLIVGASAVTSFAERGLL